MIGWGGVSGVAQADPVRVAILADTHGRVDPRILDVVATCDLAVHAGDIGGAAVLGALRPGSGYVRAVVGNNDIPSKWPPPDRELLQRLPEQLELDLPGGRLAVVHGHRTRAHDRHRGLRERFPDARVVVYGHSHRLVVDLEGEPWVVNPGAAGHDRTFGGPSCLVLLAGSDLWRLDTFRYTLARSAAGSAKGPKR